MPGAWGAVRAELKAEVAAVAEVDSSSTATEKKKLNFSEAILAREREAWCMSKADVQKLDMDTARENWTLLMQQAYDPTVPVVIFSKTLHATPQETIDARDSNDRTALMLCVLAAGAGAADDEAKIQIQEEKAMLLVEAGSNMLMWDEDEETPISLAYAQRMSGLCLKLLNAFSNTDLGEGILWEDERYPPMVSYSAIRGALARCPAAQTQTMKACTGIYAELDKEQLVAAACAAFVVSRQRTDWTEGLHNLICWAIEAKRRAVSLKLTDSMESDNANCMAVTIELAAAGALTFLSERGGENTWLYSKAGELLRSGRG